MTTEMTPEQRIDAALDSVLRAAGSALKHYTMPGTLEAMAGQIDWQNITD